MEKDLETIGSCLLVGCGIVILIPLLYFLSAFVFMWSWNIIIVYLFHAPVLNLLQAFAAVLILSFVPSVVKIVK